MQILELYNFVQALAPFTLILGVATLFLYLTHPSMRAARRGNMVAYTIGLIFLILVVLQSFVFTWDTFLTLGQG